VKKVNYKDYELSKEKYTPLYFQVKKAIDAMIQDSVFERGDKIPSENELRDHFGVSRTTIRLALKELEAEGKLNKQQGVGTFVTQPKVEHPLPSLTSFTKEVKDKGLNPGSKVINLVRKQPNNYIRKKLNLRTSEECILLERIRTIDEEKAGIHLAYLNPKLLLKHKIEDFNFENRSLYNVIQEEYGIEIGKAYETIEAAPADKYQSELLDIDVGFPMLVLERLTCTVDNIPLEFVEMYYRFDKHKYSVVLEN